MTGVVVLDLTRHGVRGVEVEGAYTAQPKLKRFGMVPVADGVIADGEILDERRGSAALSELWRSAGFRSKKVAIGISNRKVVVREMTLRPVPKAQRRAALRFAAEGQLPIDLDDAILDFVPIRDVVVDGEARQDGMLVATARGSLETTALSIEKSGRLIDAVDFSGFALMRALSSSAGETRAIINIGGSSTTVVISTGRTPEFVRIVPGGGDDITRSIERSLGVSSAEAEAAKRARGLQGGATSAAEQEVEHTIRENVAGVIDSLRSTLSFYADSHPDRPVRSIALTGGGARLTGLVPVFTRALGLPTAFGDPLATFSLPRGSRGTELERWALELAAPLGVVVGGK